MFKYFLRNSFISGLDVQKKTAWQNVRQLNFAKMIYFPAMSKSNKIPLKHARMVKVDLLFYNLFSPKSYKSD